jgi:hypothetical protein
MLAAGLASAGIAVGALIVIPLVALLVVVRVLERAGAGGWEGPGNEDEFPVDISEPEWWPEFEHRFADHVEASRRRRGLR